MTAHRVLHRYACMYVCTVGGKNAPRAGSDVDGHGLADLCCGAAVGKSRQHEHDPRHLRGRNRSPIYRLEEF